MRYAARNRVKTNAGISVWKAAHPEKVKMWTKAYIARNRERASASWRASNQRRRSLGAITKTDIEDILANSLGICVWCNAKLLSGKWHVDHVVPICKGGTNNLGNLAAACQKCNARKNLNSVVMFLADTKRRIEIGEMRFDALKRRRARGRAAGESRP